MGIICTVHLLYRNLELELTGGYEGVLQYRVPEGRVEFVMGPLYGDSTGLRKWLDVSVPL